MKRILLLALLLVITLSFASCTEDLPASDYVKKGKIVVDNTIPFVIDDSVAIDAKEAECALLVGAHYSSFAAKFGYKVFHYDDAPYLHSIMTYYTVYPLNDGRLLYLVVDQNDKGDYIIHKYSIIADENTWVNNIIDWDKPYVLMNVPMDVRESEYKNGIEKGSLVYKTYMKLEEKLGLPIMACIPSSFVNGSEWNMAVRMIKWENDSALVYELLIYTEKETSTLTKTTYIHSNGEYNKTETTEKTVELYEVASFFAALERNDFVEDSVYSDIKELNTIDKGIFLSMSGNFRYEDEWYYCLNQFNFSYNTTDGTLSKHLKKLGDLMEG